MVDFPGDWSATQFFKELAETNRLAVENKFFFCQVSGLAGLEDAVYSIQRHNNFICVSDTADGRVSLNVSPRSRRVKQVFFAMRHPPEDMAAREQCFKIMRELFRQFLSRLLQLKVQLQNNMVYLDDDIPFHEVEKYALSGCALTVFTVTTDLFTDLSYDESEWI